MGELRGGALGLRREGLGHEGRSWRGTDTGTSLQALKRKDEYSLISCNIRDCHSVQVIAVINHILLSIRVLEPNSIHSVE